MRIDIITILPEFFPSALDASIIGRARSAGLIDVVVHDLRQWTTDRHRTTDDSPFGGGPGMVMKPEPVFSALDDVIAMSERDAPVDPSHAPRQTLRPEPRHRACRAAPDRPRLRSLRGIRRAHSQPGDDGGVHRRLRADRGELPALVVTERSFDFSPASSAMRHRRWMSRSPKACWSILSTRVPPPSGDGRTRGADERRSWTHRRVATPRVNPTDGGAAPGSHRARGSHDDERRFARQIIDEAE